MKAITIIGAGLAGSEAALQLADRGLAVKLCEMRPGKMTPAHQTGLAAELVCSNSLKSTLPDTPAGMLKEELRLLGSKLLPIAESCSVPAGHALAVDRELFAQKVDTLVRTNPKIEMVHEEVTRFPESVCILCSGPLTSDALAAELQKTVGSGQLCFFDAIAPIVAADSLDFSRIYRKDRYDKGDPDYLNCPFTREEYYTFIEALLSGEQYQAREFENEFFRDLKFNYYENCTPVEELARRGKDTLRHGVMRPMGLEHEGKKPFAVLQLRTENRDQTAFNLVGCQTMLRQAEQKRIFRLIPGLEQAEFLRYGSIHRNSYLNAPQTLAPNLTLRNARHVFVAGQLSGVEGYMECVATGLLVTRILAEGIPMLPPETILGQLWRRLIDPSQKNFQPVNANFGLLPAFEVPVRDKKLKKLSLSQRGLEALKTFLEEESD
ncbi:MAG: methylenetetrahydrofolate--tRNA-(uracil(54)-C(5))-methyltransferase (FADH(2)-oxidizing) TrmFO [Candidatus Cloacimonetes bacterium]|jgi:methylenetetrahydrofolate--tRNA-(uracil-5-)-methyltransferase|nr:methylenetetrahydrofolate--tRNA-(uracil(54)-C(5))-methyltransferase (FADH(2)-oxidizing) TrmFO [Candidatus Cloacimonadota bacterium]